jgi:hypothetical protein
MRQILFLITIGILALVLLPAPSAAQDTYEVTGVVEEAETSKPLPGTNVYVPGTRTGASTDETGRYAFRLEEGKYQLVASFTGYKSDTLSITVGPNQDNRYDFALETATVRGEEVVVYANELEQRVQNMARSRSERRDSLNNYSVQVHKLGLVYENAERDGTAGSDTSQATAFSERVVRQFYEAPKTFGEQYLARRSSDNFFSGYEVFSTGGGPLNLNDNEVEVNILSETVSVVGPISENAPQFYELDDEPAGADWPEGTRKITVEPTSQRRPLFRGEVFVNSQTDRVIGMDLALNEAGDVFTGVYSFSDFHYRQEYEPVDGFWLPGRTVVQADIDFLGVQGDFTYRETWTYEDYRVNEPGVEARTIPLSGAVVSRESTTKDSTYWEDTAEKYLSAERARALQSAQSYEDDRFLTNFFMSAFEIYNTAPEFLRTSYFTNVSDFYRFNRVEGHYLGAGLRTPAVNENFTYKAAVGYATESGDARYYLEGLQYIPGTSLAVEGGVYRKLALQFADYRYKVGPMNVDEFRYTLQTAISGTDPRSYFEREGYSAGLRWRFDGNTFLRASYMREDQTFLPVTAPFSLLERFEVSEEGPVEPNLNPRVGETPDGPVGADGLEGFTEGEFSGFEFQFHYDNRQFGQNGIFRNYRVRNFGWFTDHLAHWGVGSDENFNYFKYRSSAGVRVPMFSSHYLLGELHVGGADRPLPAQMQFSNNGFYIEDYVRRRPFETLEFDEGIGNRVTSLNVDYDLGSGLTRMIPIKPIRQSGVMVRLWGSLGYRHPEASLRPVTPWTDGAQEQVEVGVSVRRILGIFSFDVGFRVEGNAGQKVGVEVLL